MHGAEETYNLTYPETPTVLDLPRDTNCFRLAHPTRLPAHTAHTNLVVVFYERNPEAWRRTT